MTRTYDSVYPMQSGGGAFLICVGIALEGGALIGPYYFGYALLFGFVAGGFAIRAVIPASRKRCGAPTKVQLRVLWSAIALEVAAFTLVGGLGLLRGHSLLFIWQASLAIVALHFIVMRWSHGPLMTWLALALFCWIGLAALAQLPLWQLAFGDGVLKLAFGIVMATPLLNPPIPAPAE